MIYRFIKPAIVAVSLCFLTITASVGEEEENDCTRWPDTSSMYTGCRLKARLSESIQVLNGLHEDLETELRDTDTPERFMEAFANEQNAWLEYKNALCELDGSSTGGGFTWQSTYNISCQNFLVKQRSEALETALQCYESARNPTVGRSECIRELLNSISTLEGNPGKDR